MRRSRAILLALTLLAAAAPAALAAPPGYTRVTSPTFQAPAGIQSGGQVDCPAGTVPWGGGAGFFGGLPSFGMSLNTSAPTLTGWRARYDNTSATAGTFGIVVECATAPKRYAQTFSTVDNPAGTQSTATATCPARTVLLGGGAFSTSDLPQAAITSAWPSSSTSYTAVLFNGTARAERLTAFAICGRRPTGYRIASNTSSGTGPADFNIGQVCPGAKTLLSGGVRIADPSPAVTFGASFQDSGEQWVGEVLAPTTARVQMTTFAICAA